MTKKLLFVTAILLVVAIGAFAADVSGKWTFEQPGRGGNPGRPVTITLKADGSNLTGTMPAVGRGGAAHPTAISVTNGEGNTNSFNVTRYQHCSTRITTHQGTGPE